MQLEVLGNGQEIGRSAFLLSDAKTSVMLDYGVKLQPEPPQYPLLPKHIDGVILSHAHLDHSGSIPALYKKHKIPAFMTDVTFDLSKMLLLDSVKVAQKQGFGAPFGLQEIKRMERHTRLMGYNEPFKAGSFSAELYDAGHIPGSAGIMLAGEKRVFYTGDIQTEQSNLLTGCSLPDGCDTLVTESTYSYKNHPSRDAEEKRLLDHIEEALAGDETALFPVFAVGRAQEVLLILEKYAHKIALDGMAKKASDIVASYPFYLRDAERLKSVLRKVHWVHTKEERLKALKKYPIVIATAGMLGGGPAVHYLREIKHRPESKVLFTGFLVEESPGRQLIETKIFQNTEEKFHVHCEVDKFELSAHAGRDGLMEIIRRTRPEKVVSIHGERCSEFVRDIEEAFPGTQALAPKNGDVIKL